ncbi:hypothetical protein S83_023912 [Arachis hypogaea]
MLQVTVSYPYAWTLNVGILFITKCRGHLNTIVCYMTWKVRDFGSSRNLLYAFGNSRWHCIFACHAVDILMGLFSSGPEMVSHAVAHEHVHSHGHGTSYPCFEYDNSVNMY